MILEWILIILCGCAVIGAISSWYMGLFNGLHILPKPRAGQIRVACVGDSITYGCLVQGQAWNNYPCHLQKLLGDDYCVGNFGYSNRTANQHGDYPYTAEQLYQKSLDFMPDIVILMLGTNDSKVQNWDRDAFLESLTGLAASYRNLSSHTELCLLLPPPVFPVGEQVRYGIRGDVIAQEICPCIEAFAKANGLRLVDTRSVFEGRKELFSDGVHPNANGAKLFAETVYTGLFKQ